jgi:hypothetical protein
VSGKIHAYRRVHLRAIEKERTADRTRWRVWMERTDRQGDAMTEARPRSNGRSPDQNRRATPALGPHPSGRGDGSAPAASRSHADPDLPRGHMVTESQNVGRGNGNGRESNVTAAQARQRSARESA